MERVDSWWPDYNEVQRRWREGRLDRSAELIQEGLARHPESPHLKLVLAQQLLLEDRVSRDTLNPGRIRRLAKEAVDAAPDSAHVLVNAAMTVLDLGDDVSAIGYLRQARKVMWQLEPASEAVAVFALARLASHQGKIQRAEELLRQAIALDDANEEYFCELAALLIRAREYERAESVAREGLKKHRGSSILRQLLARARSRDLRRLPSPWIDPGTSRSG